jgi:hypothetical protein
MISSPLRRSQVPQLAASLRGDGPPPSPPAPLLTTRGFGAPPLSAMRTGCPLPLPLQLLIASRRRPPHPLKSCWAAGLTLHRALRARAHTHKVNNTCHTREISHFTHSPRRSSSCPRRRRTTPERCARAASRPTARGWPASLTAAPTRCAHSAPS